MDWLQHLKGFMDIDLTHLWLPWKGQLNQIKVNRESYMKHIITDLNDENQPVELINSTSC